MLRGILLVDKPQGPTSHAIVAKTRKALGLKKVGHAGTLDPMATGLLVLGVGPGTKLLTFFVGLDKTYRATIRLGQATHTDDAEGEPVGDPASPEQLDSVDASRIEQALRGYTGTIDQIPSSVSAVRIDGKRAYDRVRAGEDVDIPSRQVTIHRIDVIEIRRDGPWWDIDVEIDCSSGTYIRAIARDVGNDLGVGGHLTALRRTQVGPFGVDDAIGPEEITAGSLIGLGQAASAVLPAVTLSASQSTELGHGKQIFIQAPEGVAPDAPVACLGPEGDLVAICGISQSVSNILVGFPQQEGG